MPNRTLTIDGEFKNLIPPLTKEAYDGLEQKILAEGFDAERYGALTTWNGILVDGHNRYEICCKHCIQFKTLEMDFKSRDDVRLWVYMNHINKRNLTPYQIGLIVLKMEPMIKNMAKEKERERKTTLQKSEKSNMPEIQTAKELEKLSGISHDTIFKIRKIEQEATPEQKERLSKGDVKVNAIYKEIRPKEGKSAIPKKEVDQPKIKVCKVCGYGLPETDFYEGKGLCKKCYNSTRGKPIKDIKGNIITISDELKGITEEEIIGDLYNADKVIDFTIEDFNEELGSIIDYFIRNTNRCLETHKELLADNENKQKIKANLLRTETALNDVKGRYLYE
jgi:hypothetical protein